MGCDYHDAIRSENGILINGTIWFLTVLIINGVLISPIEGNKIELFSVRFKLKTYL